MTKVENKIVKNRPSPKNEDKLINAYKSLNPKAAKSDNKDISAVRTKNGTTGHALLNQSLNRSRDNKYHRGEDFIPDSELRKIIKK